MTPSYVVLFIGILYVTDSVTSVSLTAQNQQHLVDLHNKARAEEPASNMATMTWDASLATEAQAWTDGCSFVHQQGQSWGENLSAQTYSSSNITAMLSSMFQLWMDEKALNVGGTFEECCGMSSGSCCHYTQVIWATSTNVGCGLTHCNPLATTSGGMSNALYLACYYTPRGNSPTASCSWDWSPYQTAK